MAALTTVLDTTEFQEIIPTEDIGTFVYGFEYQLPIGLSIANTRGTRGIIAARYVRMQSFTPPAGTKTQTDTYTDIETGMDEETLTPGVVGFRIPISWEMVAGSAVTGIETMALAEALRALDNRIDQDILAGSTSATNIVGADTDVFTDAKFRAAISAWHALKVPGQPVFVGHLDHIRDLMDALGSSGATLQPSMTNLGWDAPGNIGTYMGVPVFHSSNVAATGAGWSGFITTSGQAGGLGLAMSQGTMVQESHGDDATNRKLHGYFVFDAVYGAGMTNRNRILEVLGRT